MILILYIIIPVFIYVSYIYNLDQNRLLFSLILFSLYISIGIIIGIRFFTFNRRIKLINDKIRASFNEANSTFKVISESIVNILNDNQGQMLQYKEESRKSFNYYQDFHQNISKVFLLSENKCYGYVCKSYLKNELVTMHTITNTEREKVFDISFIKTIRFIQMREVSDKSFLVLDTPNSIVNNSQSSLYKNLEFEEFDKKYLILNITGIDENNIHLLRVSTRTMRKIGIQIALNIVNIYQIELINSENTILNNIDFIVTNYSMASLNNHILKSMIEKCKNKNINIICTEIKSEYEKSFSNNIGIDFVEGPYISKEMKINI